MIAQASGLLLAAMLAAQSTASSLSADVSQGSVARSALDQIEWGCASPSLPAVLQCLGYSDISERGLGTEAKGKYLDALYSFYASSIEGVGFYKITAWLKPEKFYDLKAMLDEELGAPESALTRISDSYITFSWLLENTQLTIHLLRFRSLGTSDRGGQFVLESKALKEKAKAAEEKRQKELDELPRDGVKLIN